MSIPKAVLALRQCRPAISNGGTKVTEVQIKSVPMRILKLGWGFFILITVASYTANLAANLGRAPFFYYKILEAAEKCLWMGSVGGRSVGELVDWPAQPFDCEEMLDDGGPTLLRANTTEGPHYRGPTLLRANITEGQHY